MKINHLIFFWACLCCLYSCNYNKKNTDENGGTKFVSLNNGDFYLDSKLFYPLVLNYHISLHGNTEKIWPSPYRGYYPKSTFTSNEEDVCLKELKADFDMIKDMGYNTVRIVGVGEEKVEDKIAGTLSITTINGTENYYNPLKDDKDYEKYFHALDVIFSSAEKAGLKVIFLVRLYHEIPATENYFEKILKRYKSNSTIMAYDLFNEPLYFDSLERDKKDVYMITKKWYELVKKNSPDQLCTIGLTGVREVLEWDPNLLNVDFISFHPYEYEPDQVRNEIYWYGKFVKKPWIIGETGIAADNDSISYDEQKKFAELSIKQTYNCGGIGYSWWQYKDVEWLDFHSSFLGVLNRNGETTTTKGDKIIGTPKPINDVFKIYKPVQEKENCLCLDNYYNYSQFKDFRLKGMMVDENGNPIEGGLILAWNESWSKSYHTVTKKDGTFELMGNFPFYHWKATSTLNTMVRGELSPDSSKKDSDNIPFLDMGKLRLEKLNLD